MTHLFPSYNWPDSDPAPDVPTLAEIQFAEEIRRRLELRLLSRTDWPTKQFGAVEYDWANSYVE